MKAESKLSNSTKPTKFTFLSNFRICRWLLVLVFVRPLLSWPTNTWEKRFQGWRVNFGAWRQGPCSLLGRTSDSEPQWGKTSWLRYPYGAAFLTSWWSAGMGGTGRKGEERRRKRWRKKRGWGGGGSTQGWDTWQSCASNHLLLLLPRMFTTSWNGLSSQEHVTVRRTYVCIHPWVVSPCACPCSVPTCCLLKKTPSLSPFLTGTGLRWAHLQLIACWLNGTNAHLCLFCSSVDASALPFLW